MATYEIESSRQNLRATGVVKPVMQWVEDPTTGKRKRSNAQDFDPESGHPLWAVEVQYLGENFGEPQTQVVTVTVPAHAQPAPAAFEVVAFEGLTVNVSVNRSNATLRESWRAAGIAGTAGQNRKQSEAA